VQAADAAALLSPPLIVVVVIVVDVVGFIFFCIYIFFFLVCYRFRAKRHTTYRPPTDLFSYIVVRGRQSAGKHGHDKKINTISHILYLYILYRITSAWFSSGNACCLLVEYTITIYNILDAVCYTSRRYASYIRNNITCTHRIRIYYMQYTHGTVLNTVYSKMIIL